VFNVHELEETLCYAVTQIGIGPVVVFVSILFHFVLYINIFYEDSSKK
jgi:hypothetical protein